MLPLCMKSKEEGTEIVTPGEFYITAFLHKHSLPLASHDPVLEPSVLNFNLPNFM